MSKKRKHSHTVTLTVPLNPDQAGEQQLLRAERVTHEVHDAVSIHLASLGTQRPLSLIQAASGRFRPASSAHSMPRVRVTQAQVAEQLKQAGNALSWHLSLPASSVTAVAYEVLRDFQRGVQPPPHPRSIQLVGGLWAVNAYQVFIHLLGPHALQSCDVFALPAAYAAALERRRVRHLHSEATRFQSARDRFLGGQPEAFTDCLRIGGRLPPTDLTTRTGPALEESDLRCLEPAFIRRVIGTGWEIGLTFAVPDALPQAIIDDTVGVDVGADMLLSWASGSEEGSVPQRLLQLPMPQVPTPSWGRGPTPFNPTLGAAQGRHVIFAALRPGYEAAIGQLLRYRRIAIEDIDWSSFRSGFAFDEFARISYLHAALGWLEALAPLHGSVVVRVPPHLTSRTCSCCGWVNRRRPRRKEPFRCGRPGCFHVQDAHLNASLVIRSRDPWRRGR